MCFLKIFKVFTRFATCAIMRKFWRIFHNFRQFVSDVNNKNGTIRYLCYLPLWRNVSCTWGNDSCPSFLHDYVTEYIIDIQYSRTCLQLLHSNKQYFSVAIFIKPNASSLYSILPNFCELFETGVIRLMSSPYTKESIHEMNLCTPLAKKTSTKFQVTSKISQNGWRSGNQSIPRFRSFIADI